MTQKEINEMMEGLQPQAELNEYLIEGKGY